MKNDSLLSIATAKSRKAKIWKNEKILWSDLVEKLSHCLRTPETVSEFKAMSRDRQSEIKDVGGFVGGYCENGKRTNTKFRSVITLDADFAESVEDICADWETLYGNAAVVYSTHKHTPENPRLRFVIPLSRTVTPDEYQAVARRIASVLNIELFDDSTYQPQRLMYWPSASSDGEYIFREFDSEFLNPDAELKTYVDWTDMSSWPVSSRVTHALDRTVSSKQKDPLAKPGLIGAFCRSYTIQEAIEKFVPDYEPCGENRFTYTQGTAAGGIVTYDDKFSFSHHSTDPASGVLCNAWDLVRIHMFGQEDDAGQESKDPTKLKSYGLMCELASKDPVVKRQIMEDRLESITQDFTEEPDSEETAESDDWFSSLDMNKRGEINPSIDNVVKIIMNDKSLKNCVAINEFTQTIEITRKLPWITSRRDLSWSDEDDANLRHFIERKYGVSAKDKIFDALNVVAGRRRYHPIRDYLESLSWDGEGRVDSLLIDFLGAEDSNYIREVTRKHMVAAVARIFRPGTKYDYILTVRGSQGLGKSTLISKLGKDWYSDSFTTMSGKEAYEQVQGSWIIEMGELAGLKRAETEQIKLFVSKQEDRFRPAYGRRIRSFPRQCVFWATTNEMSEFLRDNTGNRRFWIVDTPNEATKSVWDDLTPEYVDQLWAEAVSLYKNGETLFLSKEANDTAREIQESNQIDTPQIGLVLRYLDRKLPDNWDELDLPTRRMWLSDETNEGTVERIRVTRIEIWSEALNKDPNMMDSVGSRRVGELMYSAKGWRYRGNSRSDIAIYGRQRYYDKDPKY